MKKASLILPLLFLISGCTKNTKSTDPPLCLGLTYDVSKSVANVGLPPLTSAQLERMLSLLKARGGIMAFGLVDEMSFEPLIRLKLDPITGRLDQRAQRNQKNIKAIKEFINELNEKIQRPRNARGTDIYGSLARFTLFFNEPTHPRESEKVLLFLSDGIHTSLWPDFKNSEFPLDIHIFVVGIEADLARKLFGKNPILFESIDAAIDNLSHAR